MIAFRGGFNGVVSFYINTGSPSQPVYEYVRTIASNQDWSPSGPDLVDIDGDEDLDLFFGDGLNHLQYWENIGSISYPRFELQSENYLNQPTGGVQLYPRFNDIDHDGDFDLIMGYGFFSNSYCYVKLWENIGTSFNPQFIESDTIDIYDPATVQQPSPCFGDIDGDGDDDMFVGESGGALLFYRNLENSFQAQLTITIKDNDIILTWGDVANAVEYQIFYQNIPYFTPSGIPQAIVLPPDTVWTDFLGLNEGKRYYRMITVTP